MSRASRRQFMQTTALTGFGFWVAGGVRAQESKSPNSQIRVACVGVGGKGASDTDDAAKFGTIVALCDADKNTLGKKAEKYPGAKTFNDFRKMFDAIGKEIDAVTVSTPDHNHAVAAVMAMKMGKHCFCQKPLTRAIHEARVMAEVAKEKGVATQMGNQGTAGDSLRRAAATIKAGAVGTAKEVHVWTNRPIWPQGGSRPEPSPVPDSLDWEVWIGPSPMRPYAAGAYHPFKWRGWWDFGTGALGDMACHTFNMPYMALDLKNPTSVVAETSGHNKDSYPARSKITFEFPANDKRPALKVVWYDGGNLPSEDLFVGLDKIMVKKGKKGKEEEKPLEVTKSGALIIGDKGQLYAPGDYCGEYHLLNGANQPEVDFVKSPGHMQEWFDAMKGGPAAMSNFATYSGGLTETMLLGNLAVWACPEPGVGKRIEWDAKALKTLNAPEVEHIVRPEYRKGYSL